MGITILKEITEAEAGIEKAKAAAEKKAADMIKQAEQDVNAQIDKTKESIEAAHKAAIEAVKAEVEKEKESKLKQAESDVASLKEKAAAKRNEAVEYVYSEFLNQFN